MEQADKMKEYIDTLIELKEKLKEAEDQERFWRSQTTSLRNRINDIQKEGKDFCKELFGD